MKKRAGKRQERREVSTMRYEKPQIVYLGDAVSVVLGGKEDGGSDSSSLNQQSTPAYQADE